MSESAASAIRRFVEELADLRRAAGSPSLRDMARSSPNHKLAHSTAGDALKGDRLPSLQPSSWSLGRARSTPGVITLR